AFLGMDVEHRRCFELRFVLFRVDAIHRTCVNASRVLGADAGFTNDICHRIESPCLLMPETGNETEIIHCGEVKSTRDVLRQARAVSIRLSTFPVGVRGRSATISKYFGTL